MRPMPHGSRSTSTTQHTVTYALRTGGRVTAADRFALPITHQLAARKTTDFKVPGLEREGGETHAA